MKNSSALLLCAGYALLLSACSRSPLDPSPTSPGAASLSASAVVRVYDGATPAPASATVRVAMLAPDGSRRDAGTGLGAWAGQCVAQFDGLTQAGAYRFGLADQATQSPGWVTLELKPGGGNLEVPLQRGGAGLTVTDEVQGQPNDFHYSGSTWSYRLAWRDESQDRKDVSLDIDPASLPAGWTYVAVPPVLAPGGTSLLTVHAGDGTQAATVNLSVRALAGPTAVALASKALVRDWTMELDLAWEPLLPLINAPQVKVCTWTVPLTVSARVVGTHLPVGAFATVSLPHGARYSNTADWVYDQSIGCGWADQTVQGDAGGTLMLVNAGARTQINGAFRTWTNSGWTLRDNLVCVSGHAPGGVQETFVFNVRLGSADVPFTKVIHWPLY